MKLFDSPFLNELRSATRDHVLLLSMGAVLPVLGAFDYLLFSAEVTKGNFDPLFGHIAEQAEWHMLVAALVAYRLFSYAHRGNGDAIRQITPVSQTTLYGARALALVATFLLWPALIVGVTASFTRPETIASQIFTVATCQWLALATGVYLAVSQRTWLRALGFIALVVAITLAERYLLTGQRHWLETQDAANSKTWAAALALVVALTLSILLRLSGRTGRLTLLTETGFLAAIPAFVWLGPDLTRFNPSMNTPPLRQPAVTLAATAKTCDGVAYGWDSWHMVDLSIEGLPVRKPTALGYFKITGVSVPDGTSSQIEYYNGATSGYEIGWMKKYPHGKIHLRELVTGQAKETSDVTPTVEARLMFSTRSDSPANALWKIRHGKTLAVSGTLIDTPTEDTLLLLAEKAGTYEVNLGTRTVPVSITRDEARRTWRVRCSTGRALPWIYAPSIDADAREFTTIHLVPVDKRTGAPTGKDIRYSGYHEKRAMITAHIINGAIDETSTDDDEGPLPALALVQRTVLNGSRTETPFTLTVKMPERRSTAAENTESATR